MHFSPAGRGGGLSEPTGSGDGIDGFTRFADGFVPGVLDALEIDRADVVEASMGGLIAIRSAIAHPERILSLVQLACCPGAEAQELPLSMRIAALPGIAAATARMPPNRMAIRAIPNNSVSAKRCGMAG